MVELRGKRVLVTGAARGIGRALARRFAARGSALVLTDIDRDPLETVSGEVRALGVEAWPYRLDVTDVEAVRRTRDAVVAECGPIDVLVNNAGVVFGGPFLDVPFERHRATYAVNVLGLVAVTHAFLDDLLARPSAHVVNMASASAYLGLPFAATYASSKWAVLGFSESLRGELRLLGHRHVGVTAVCPSYVGTGLFDGARPARGTRVIDPDRLAETVVTAVERGRRVVRTPWLVKLTPLLKGVLPGPLFDAISGVFGATSSMTGWRGRGSGRDSR